MATTLTIALAVVIVVPALVGYWRDPRRGMLALAGTLLGATLADFWAARWGQELAASLGGKPRVLALFTGYGALALGALLIGYGAGELLPPPPARPSLPRRLLGALLGLLNGVLIAGYVLRLAAETDAGFEQELRGVALARLVLDGLPLLFLALAAVLAALILARRMLLLIRQLAARPAPPPQQPTPPAAPPQPSPPKEVQRKG
ncbi:MAG TPA: CvpA family protein [Roseiflexaceae bacterium]|nr:CvpA family protein [Roseiflexaceae bacterium]